MAEILQNDQTDNNQHAVPPPEQEYRRRLAAMEHEFDDRGDGVMSDYDQDASQPLERYRAAIQAAKMDYREIRSAIDSQFRLIREASDDEYENYRKTVKGDHEQAVKRLQATHRDVMATARKEYQSRVEAARQDYVTERKKIVDDYEGNPERPKPPIALAKNADDQEEIGRTGNKAEPVAIARADAKRAVMDDPVWLRFCDAAEAVYNEARDFFVKKE